MILFLGILMLVLPFLAVFLFQDRLKGIVYVLVFGTSFHLFVSLITQYFGLFKYSVIIPIHLAVLCGIIIAVFIRKRKFWNLKVDLLVVLAFLIIFFEFWTVHYNYTGTVATLNGFSEVTKDSYSYPMFSDEWIAAGLIKYSIDSGSLPLVNPLNENKPFPNLLMIFHSAVAEFFLLLGIDPVLNFAVLAIMSGMIVTLSVFILLRSLGVNSRVSAITILFLPFMTQAGYLPGLWFILPYTAGLIFFLLSMSGLSQRDMKISVMSAFLSFLFYPPIIVFLGSAYLIFFMKKISSLACILFVIFTPVFLSETIASKIIRSNIDGGMLTYPFLSIIPWVILPFALIGLYTFYKTKKYFLLLPNLVGIVLWVVYSFCSGVFIIESGRVVVITFVLLVISAGIGIDKYKKIISQTPISASIISFFALLALFYPFNDHWKDITIRPFDKKITASLQSPNAITRYLTSTDLELFKNIKKERFIAPPWKALVIGITTDNDPLESKPSTITTNLLKYKKFMDATCQEKMIYTNQYRVSWVYSALIDCPGFNLINKSPEGLKLYKVTKF